MWWRKERNDYIDSAMRFDLTPEQRDVYHCLRCLAGSDMGRYGHIERNEMTPLTPAELESRMGIAADVIESAISVMVAYKVLGETQSGHWYFTDWLGEQGVPLKYKKRRPLTPDEQELKERTTFTTLATDHPDWLNPIVDKRVAKAMEASHE